MADKGYIVGPRTMVKYVISKHGKKIRDKVRLPEEVKREDIDVDYYINNQIIPAVESIFSVLGYNVEQLITKKQKDLGEYFK